MEVALKLNEEKCCELEKLVADLQNERDSRHDAPVAPVVAAPSPDLVLKLAEMHEMQNTIKGLVSVCFQELSNEKFLYLWALFFVILVVQQRSAVKVDCREGVYDPGAGNPH